MSEATEVHIEELQGLTGEGIEENAIILEIIEPSTEEGSEELDKSGIRKYCFVSLNH